MAGSGYDKAHYNLGNLYAKQKNYTRAVEEYQKALKINPAFAEAYYDLGVLYYEQKNHTKAIKEYQKAPLLNF